MANILLIEDDKNLGASISENLEFEGHSVDWVSDGKEALEYSLRNIHEIILLDIMLPNMNGIEILKEIRQHSNIPVLITSAKSRPTDRIQGLKLQADDYLTKPFHLEELVLRVSSLLRRSQVSSVLHEIETVDIGKCSCDFLSNSISKDGKNIKLSDKEIRLLRFLFLNQGKVKSRQEIMDAVWGIDAIPSPRSIDNIILKLRKWIEESPDNPKLIHSHHGVGYSLEKLI